MFENYLEEFEIAPVYYENENGNKIELSKVVIKEDREFYIWDDKQLKRLHEINCQVRTIITHSLLHSHREYFT